MRIQYNVDARTSLSNKVNSVPIVIQPTVDVLTLECGHVYAVEGEISTEYNHPINTSYAHLTYEVLGSDFGSNGYKVIKCIDAYSAKIGIISQKFNAWTKRNVGAFANPLQEYDLPFTDGFSNAYDNYPSMYSKTQEGLVTVIMNLKADTLSTGTVVATLPSGFRPSHNISFVAKFGVYKTEAANIYTNGNISINGPFQTGETAFSFIGSFIAGG